MALPKTPEGWASRLMQLLEVTGKLTFPINIQELAKGYSKSAFPKDSIVEIEGADCEGFEGMLAPIPGRGWGLVYNNSGSSKGRINFSIAHEFGHYLLHRKKYPKGKQCTVRDMMDWQSEEAKIESEANEFAASLLMPIHDFRSNIEGRKTNLQLFSELAERYEVSLTASILRWLGFTDERAMIVVGKDGFIDWAWSSRPLLKSKIFYRPKKETIELPKMSLAARRDPGVDNKSGVKHPPGIWLGEEDVEEMTLVSKEYNNMTISLLKYPKNFAGNFDDEDEHAEDLLDRFERWR